jgi:DNA-binding winged helix-turn-helix (wHTH) protein
MDPSFDHHDPPRKITRGRFTRVSVQSPAGEIDARLSEQGIWELRVRRDNQAAWRVACSGDIACGATKHPAAFAQEQGVITLGALTVDPAGRRVTVDGNEVRLCRKEFALLLVLAAQPDRIFAREELMARVWRRTDQTRTRTLDAHAGRLRRKLANAGAPGFVINIWGVGYRFRERTESSGSDQLQGKPPNAHPGLVLGSRCRAWQRPAPLQGTASRASADAPSLTLGFRGA